MADLEQPEFLPSSRREMEALGWDELDVLLVSGDAHVDSHAFAAALLGRWLVAHGYRTGIIAQPAWNGPADVSRLGRPRLFAGISSGSVDSLVAHYTAFRKKRSEDAYSPGGRTGLRPNRAVSVYAGLVRQAFPGLCVVAGGIEASLRRASHYDFWSDALRRPLLLDAKLDAILHGMGEKPILSLARLLENHPLGRKHSEVIARSRLPGFVYETLPDRIPSDAAELPSHEAILADPAQLIGATLAFERQTLNGRPALIQRVGGRTVIFEPPAEPLSEAEMDAVYSLPFTRRAHPDYREPIPAVAMLEGSLTSHRGCGGGCSFCAISIHQGRRIQSRSGQSILAEIKRMAAAPDWKGAVTDIGGPTSNMWGAVCSGDPGHCRRTSCLYPGRCRFFRMDQEAQIRLFDKAARISGVRHVRAASGVRHDLALESEKYLESLVTNYAGGQLKIAPEHVADKLLRLMRKPPLRLWNEFVGRFTRLSQQTGREQYIVPYLMSAFPGGGEAEMRELASWLGRRGWKPRQVQCFLPVPGTLATAMFFAGVDADGRPIEVARSDADRLRLHRILMPETGKDPRSAGTSREQERRGEGKQEKRLNRPGTPQKRRKRILLGITKKSSGNTCRRPRSSGD
ncbi:MAG: YgiQ family radical SAM protein [Planctomycetota bacterium]|jgi:uncharacterized radical SAM protein YgiQ|nr:YgiQ family radical SAM protein [Planctomycetota bacterium]